MMPLPEPQANEEKENFYDFFALVKVDGYNLPLLIVDWRRSTQ